MSTILGEAIGFLDLDTSGFKKGLSQASEDLKVFMDKNATAQDKLAGFGSAMSSAGSSLTKWVTLPLVGVGTAAVAVGNEFEAAMSQVKAISGATGEEFEALREQALQLGADTSFSASSAAEGMQNLASAGFTVEEIMGAMPGLLDLAASSGADLGVASEIAASAIRGFGLDATDAARVADVFAEASARTNAQVEDLGEAMKYIAPVASAMGLSIEEVTAAVGFLSDAGIKGSQAGTSLRGALSRLASPTEKSAKVMEELGMSFYDTEGNMLSLSGIVEQLQAGMLGLTQEQRNQALITIFGQESLSGMLALIDRGPEELKDMTKAFEEADGSAKEMAEVMLDNTAGAMEALGGSIETLAIKLQEIMAPTITAIVEKITEWVNWIGSLDEETQKTIVKIAAFVAALGPALLIIGKVVTGVSTAIGVFKSLAAIIKGYSTVMVAFGNTFLPITTVIAAVAAAVVALKVAWDNNFAGIQEKTKELVKVCTEIFNTIIEALKKFGETITRLWEEDFAGIRTFFENTWAAIEKVFGTVLDTIIGVFETFSLILQGDWEGAWNKIKETAANLWNGITSAFGSFLDGLVNFLINIGANLYVAAKGALEWVSTGFVEVWNTITSWFSGVVNDPVGTIEGIGTAMYNAGVKIFTSLWDGLKSIWNSITGWVTDSINWLWDKITFWDNSVSKMEADVEKVRNQTQASNYITGGISKVQDGDRLRSKQQSPTPTPSAYRSSTYGQPLEVSLSLDRKKLGKVVISDINSISETDGYFPLKI